MKKKALSALGLICGLTVLSSCGMFSSSKETLATQGRISPMLNQDGMAPVGYAMPPMMPIDAPMGSSAPMGAMAMDRSMPPMGSMPMAPEPPSFGGGISSMPSIPLPPAIPQGGFSSQPPVVISSPLNTPPLPGQQSLDAPVLVGSASDNGMKLSAASSAFAPVPSFAPPAEPVAERRLPEFNRTVLLGEEPLAPVAVSKISLPSATSSGDLVAVAPRPPVTQTSIAALDDSRVNEYPKLAQVPPTPPIVPSIESDARVKQMRDDLAKMEMPLPPAPPAMVAAPLPEVKPIITPVMPPAAPQFAAMPPAPPVPVMSPPQMMMVPPPPPIAFSAPATPASTSLSDLRPLTMSNSNFEPAFNDGYTHADSLMPLSGHGQYKTLPDSRYAKSRVAARNGKPSSVNFVQPLKIFY